MLESSNKNDLKVKMRLSEIWHLTYTRLVINITFTLIVNITINYVRIYRKLENGEKPIYLGHQGITVLWKLTDNLEHVI